MVTLCASKPKTVLSPKTLKIIAIVAMLIDHIALIMPVDHYSSPLVALMRFVGRCTAPLMFFFIAEGYHYTRNINRYTKRLAIFALISYFPFILFHNNGMPTSILGWMKFNVIYTLLLGLIAIRARHEIKNVAVSTCLVGLCLLASILGDWSYMGVIAILLFDLFHGNLKNQRVGFCLIAVLWGVLPYVADIVLGGLPIESLGYLVTAMFIQLGMLIPMILLKSYNAKGERGNKWFFYIFYPSHLIVLYVIAKSFGLIIS